MSSQYNLQLKATLDTSDVKKKLDELKKQTQEASQATSPAGNSNGISGALSQLNTTLQHLQASIDRLALKQNAGAGSQVKPTMPIAAPSGRVNLGSGAKQDAAKQSPTAYTSAVNASIKRMQQQLKTAFGAADPGLVAVQKQFKQFKLGRISGTQLWRNIDSYNDYTPVEQFQSRWGSARNFQNAINSERIASVKRNINRINAVEGQQPKTQSVASRQQRYVNKQLAMMGTGIVLGGLAEYQAARGNEGASRALGAAASIGQGAAMGGLIGGPAGAAIGAAAGGLTAAFDELTRRVKEQTAALEEQKQRVFSGQSVDNTVHDWIQGREDASALKKGDLKYFKDQLEREKGFSDQLQKQLEEGEIGFGGEGKTGLGGLKQTKFNLREYQQETARLLELRGKDDAEVKRRQSVATLYEANVKQVMKHGSRADQLQSIVDQLTKQKEDEAKSKASGKDSKAGLSIKQIAKIAEIDGWIGNLEEHLQGMKAPDMGNVNSLASQGFMISQADDEARLQMQNDYLRDIAYTTREIKNLEMKKEEVTYS